MTLSDIEKLARAIDDFDSTDAAQHYRECNEPPTCLACNGEYQITSYGNDPTALDDACAHETAAELARALLLVLPTIHAACLWRHGVVEMPDGRLVDSDDGNVEQGMSRPPGMRVLIDAIDTMRAEIGGEG